jgi:type II secretory pathway pseudopilin PulG
VSTGHSPVSTQRGATLLEVLIVAGLVAGLTGTVWLVQPLLARMALRAAAVTLVADLRSVQARAIAERQSDRGHGIEFPADGSHYNIFTRTGSVTIIVREQRLPDRVRLTHARFGGVTPSSVFFTGVSLFGAPSGGGTVTLTAGDARLCVRVMPATGRIRVSHITCP